ncbi:MAG: DUF3291 domain-containing protein [Pseudomonadota bacterium]
MSGPRTHLAQLNVGRLAADKDDPSLAEFMDNLDRVNGLAERSEGFVWRYVGDSGCAAEDAPYDPEDPRVIVNLSVWESVEALERFVWMTLHKRFYAKRGAWFTPMKSPHFVMWPVAKGAVPTLEEAKARLEELRAHGPSARAFGWETAPGARLWREARCA